MREGWNGDEYLVLFEEHEIQGVSRSYGISEQVPNCLVVGLRGWDDFIVEDHTRSIFTIPTVPASLEYARAFQLPSDLTRLKPDPRFQGRIKWYVMPLIFGGDPSGDSNRIWVSHQEHAELVRWWNQKYRQMKQRL